MVKKQHTQSAKKGGITPEQSAKLDELADKVSKLPERRQKLLNDLLKKKLLDSNEVCLILGISIPTLRRWVSRNEIKYVKVSKYLRFPSEEIAALVQNQAALSITEAAEILGVGIVTIRNMIKRGEIQAFRMSPTAHYRIPKSEIEKFIEG